MPQYTSAEIGAALARANGQTLAMIKNAALAPQSAEDRGPSRNFGANPNHAYKDKTGHTYAHVATFSEGSLNPTVKGMALTQAAGKSRWQDRRTCIEGTREVVNSVAGQAVVALFAAAPAPTGPQRIGPGIALTGDYYGYEAGSSVLRKISKGTTCIYIAANVLFITTSYPEEFVAGAVGLRQDEDLDLSTLFA
ncbi:MAG TPA: hypothetical protein VG248_08000 [Caulobacteraceae bacterium]|nr:hypothetical protein [Caulobacteraceae bacterium]